MTSVSFDGYVVSTLCGTVQTFEEAIPEGEEYNAIEWMLFVDNRGVNGVLHK